MKTNCPCDEIIFPPRLAITAGLESLPRQLATFPEFRAAMLAAIGSQAALRNWRARSSDDLGVMTLEMWAYVCDVISFYDEALANEFYLRTADLRPSLRKLVGLLGYVPRPAVAATANLAILAEGRQPITLPPGTSFRSGAFAGSPPQVFELETEFKAHPFLNKWKMVLNRPTTIDEGKNLSAVQLTSLLLDPPSVNIKAEQVFLFEVTGDASKTRARAARNVSNHVAADGFTYKKLEWDGFVTLPGNTQISRIRISRPTQTATLWKLPTGPGSESKFGKFINVAVQKPGGSSGTLGSSKIIIEEAVSLKDLGSGGGIDDSGSQTILYFDGLYRQVQTGGILIIENNGELRWFQIADAGEVMMELPGGGDTKIKDASGNTTTVTAPPALAPVTYARLDKNLNDSSRKSASAANWSKFDIGAITVHFNFVNAGAVVASAFTELRPGDSIALARPFETPQDKKSPNRFLLEDKDNTGAEISGQINFMTGAFALDQNSPLKQPLVAPVEMYGNVVTASHGESVTEILGSGDASIANQSFKLRKKPLTYVPSPTAGNEQGAKSALKVYVSGVLWSEKPSFFGQPSDAQVYIVRENDDAEAIITFGDGVRGSRLITGINNVVALYRFGAGKTSPPAGSIHQLGKPVKGIRSVRNPVAASGGDDAEPASGLRTYAPRSALLLGRAVSIQDMEAAAAGVPGVRAVRAEWRWNKLRQRPLVQIWYIGAAGVAQKVSQTLRGLSDPATPVEVEQAQSVAATLAISIHIDPRRLEADVIAAMRAALMDKETGLLAPERIGIGLPLFRSRIFEEALSVPGAIAVTGLLWNEQPFDPYGIQPDAGKYFDLENGLLLLNGKAGVNG